jgi:LCP family protein required for cell wall assembly
MRAPRPKRSDGRRRRASARPRPLLGIALIVLGFVLSGTGGAAAYFAPVALAAFRATGQAVHVTPHPTITPSPGGAATPAPSASQGSQSAFTVLLLGSDNDSKYDNWGGKPLSQSMILVRVDPANQAVTMLSIPRDFYVPIWANGRVQGQDKIMTAFSVGGAQAAVETVENNFNVKIDNYVWVGLKGLIKLIDLVGGVDVVPTNPVLDDYYPNDIDTENPFSYLRVAVLPGAQHMNGTQAMQYVRSRHSDPNGDLGRSARQQQVLVALKAQAKNMSPSDLPDLASTFSGELATDIDIGRVRELLPVATRIRNGNIDQIVLNGYGYNANLGGEEVIIPDVGAVQATMHKYFPAAA